MNGQLKRWYVYPFSYTFTTASTRTAPQQLGVSSEYDFVIQKITSKQTSTDFKLRIQDSEFQWSNADVDQPNFAGTAQYPNIMIEPIKIPKNTNIEIVLINGATASNAIQLMFEGYLVQNMVPTNRRWYQYILDFPFTVASQQLQRGVNISSYKNFLVQKMYANATATDYQVDIIDANLKWTQNYVYGANLIGTVQRPNVVMTPIPVVSNTSILVQAVNGATASNTVQVVLEGYLER